MVNNKLAGSDLFVIIKSGVLLRKEDEVKNLSSQVDSLVNMKMEGGDTIFPEVQPSLVRHFIQEFEATNEDFDDYFELPPGTAILWSCVGSPPIQ